MTIEPIQHIEARLETDARKELMWHIRIDLLRRYMEGKAERNEMLRSNDELRYVTRILNDLFMDDVAVIRTPFHEMEQRLEMAFNVPTVRLSFNMDGSINTMAWPDNSAIFSFDDKVFVNSDELPDWVQKKLAVLMVIDPNDMNTGDIPTVGRRISENTFWVYADGDDTGSESKETSTG